MAFDFTADHIAAATGGYEPQRLNHFTVRFANLGPAEILEKSLSQWTPPTRSISEVVIPYANEDRKVAGRVTVSDATMVIVDYCDKDTWAEFDKWLNLVHNPQTGAIGLASAYKKEGSANYYGPDGTLKRSWTVIGCWPKTLSTENFSMDSGERNNLSCTISVDKVIPAGLT